VTANVLGKPVRRSFILLRCRRRHLGLGKLCDEGPGGPRPVLEERTKLQTVFAWRVEQFEKRSSDSGAGVSEGRGVVWMLVASFLWL